MLNIQTQLHAIENSLVNKLSAEQVLSHLEVTTGIKHSIWEDKLVVLNYCQLESDKNSPIARECRSLVLEMGTWEVVSRSFDRFFNYGEAQTSTDYKIEELVAHEKVDGSLIGLFNYKGEWLYRTRSVIMPTAVINGNAQGITWKDRIEESLGDFNGALEGVEGMTFIGELTCRENRVVTKYDHDGGRFHLLALRDNESGVYFPYWMLSGSISKLNNVVRPERYTFNTIQHCIDSAKELRNLEEGFVMYTKLGVPVMKVKNPAYVAAHHLRGEGVLSEKRVVDLVIMGETDEYLAIFPEDTEVFQPYIDAMKSLGDAIGKLGSFISNFTGTQKDFALAVKDLPISSIAFPMKSGKSYEEAWNRLTENSKRNMIVAYVAKGV